MKKLFVFAAAALAAAITVISCTKEVNDPTENTAPVKEEEPQEKPDENPGQEDETLPEGMIRLVFSVSSEGENPDAQPAQTKTTWDGTTHAWKDGDQVRILWGEADDQYVDATVSGGQVNAVVADVETYYAVYPASAASDFVLNADGTIDVSIPKEQDGTFASANKMVAKTTKSAAAFAFKNVTHIFKFHLTSACNYDDFVFTSNENAKLIVDAIGVTFDGSNDISLGASTSTFGNTHSKYVYLNDLAANSDYYFAVVPDSDFSTGFGVKGHINESADTYDLGAISKGAITTTRSKITDLGNLDEMIHADWFFAPSGTGKGTSWEDAGGLDLFLSLIKYKTNDKGVNSTWRLKNAKLHFKEGTYNIEEANGGSLTFQSGSWDESAEDKYKVKNITVIDGGYPASNTGTSLAGQDAKNCPTEFICKQAAQNDRIFYFNGCSINDLQFKGITFTANPSASNNNTRGVAFFFNSTTSGKVSFDNCYFTGLISASTNGGGAIDFNSTGELTVNFSNCTFSSNTANATSGSYGGGAVVVEQGTSTVINFDRCIADGNTSTSANGHGGFLYQKGGTVTITNSEIKNSFATKRGGAIWTNATLNIENTTFASNNASNGGAIHSQAGATVTIIGSTFSANTATNGAAVRTEGASGNIERTLIFNCLFDSNTPTTKFSETGGGDVCATTAFSRLLIANSTLRGSTGVALITNGSPNFNVISSTFAENLKDFNRDFDNGIFHNTILSSADLSSQDKVAVCLNYSIFGSVRYGAKGEAAVENESGLGASCLGTFSDSNGVYPLNPAKSASYGAGMSAAEIKGLTLTDITLTDDQKALLAKDQKGNPREGTIMGAYVKTTAPTE